MRRTVTVTLILIIVGTGYVLMTGRLNRVQAWFGMIRIPMTCAKHNVSKQTYYGCMAIAPGAAAVEKTVFSRLANSPHDTWQLARPGNPL
jgi:hypothetical protein